MEEKLDRYTVVYFRNITAAVKGKGPRL